ncbi:Hypothetical protein mma_1737 [Janthinobacterium sp. Marseille]|nr:hypothetical protein [Janthinobacterium sp. Marseille]ABR91919.1 Hypothetical protein mma_1737 [Janthinobacterium sp. Marseille]
MTDEENLARELEERKRLYERHREELSKRQISNAENLDKSILTYSAAGLALSLGFLKDFIPISQAKYAWALYGSWACFTFAIVVVITSYVVSLKVLRLQLDRAERYYLSCEDAACNESLWWDKCADLLNHWLSAVAFGVALVLTIFFVSINLRGANMAENKVTRSIAQDGATGLSMQKVVPRTQIVERGITGMPVQAVTPPSPANNQGSSQQGQHGTSTSSGGGQK